MKNIVFIAPPAAGKGTQSDLLVAKYNYKHISTGDLLRNEVKSGSELGKKIDSLLKTGDLVSDDIVNSLLTKELSSDDRPFILDGYPRNMRQVPYLDEILSKIGKSLDAVISLDVPYELLVKRVVGRVYCPKCGKTYHKEYKKPIVSGMCDDCKSELLSRVDDNEETFKIRYNTYLNNTEPLLDYYQSQNLLHVITNQDMAEETFAEIEKVIK